MKINAIEIERGDEGLILSLIQLIFPSPSITWIPVTWFREEEMREDNIHIISENEGGKTTTFYIPDHMI